MVYYQCGRINHSDDGCKFFQAEPYSEENDCHIQQDNFIDVGQEGNGPLAVEPMVIKKRVDRSTKDLGDDRLVQGIQLCWANGWSPPSFDNLEASRVGVKGKKMVE